MCRVLSEALCAVPLPAIRPPHHSPVATLIQSTPLPGCWGSAVRCCLEAVGLPLVRYHLLGAFWIIMSMTIFQQPSAVGLVSSAVTENWGLWKISINHYRFGAGRVNQRNQSHLVVVLKFNQVKQTRHRLPFCAHEPGQLRTSSKQMAEPVLCHPGPPHCLAEAGEFCAAPHLCLHQAVTRKLTARCYWHCRPGSGQITGILPFLFSAPAEQLPALRCGNPEGTHLGVSALPGSILG